MRPLQKRATLFLVLVFLCGALAGAVATNVWFRMGSSISSAQADAPQPVRKRAVETFSKHLMLTPEQTQQLSQILHETSNAYRNHELAIEKIRRQGNARIREILTDEQKVKFDDLLARREKKRKK